MEVPESSEQIGNITIPIIKFTKRNNLEDCMIHQARLAHRLRREITRTYLNKGQSSSADTSEGKSSSADSLTPFFRLKAPVELQMHENDRVIAVSVYVALLHPTGGVGLLEAQLNGFKFTSQIIRMVIMNANVDGCFFRGRYLLFHLKHPIVVEGRAAKNFKFRFHDSSGAGGGTIAEEMEMFVYKIKRTQLTYRGDVPNTPIYLEALDECRFGGVLPTGRKATFGMTYSSLVIEGFHEPFIVVPLGDIEIVNLALFEPEMIHMTVVFKDFKCVVLDCALLEIYSVRLEFLPAIKSRLDFVNVKYYVNSKEQDWSDIVKRISESPEAFVGEGGWESLHLEDDPTLAYYPDADSGSDSEKYSTSIW